MTLVKTPKVLYIAINLFLLLFPGLMLQPLSPLIVLDACDGDNSKASIIIGVISALNSFGSLLSAPFLGALSDRFGRKIFLELNTVILFAYLFWRFLQISTFINIAGYLIVVKTKSLWLLYITSLIAGVLSSLYGISSAYVADITSEEGIF